MAVFFLLLIRPYNINKRYQSSFSKPQASDCFYRHLPFLNAVRECCTSGGAWFKLSRGTENIGAVFLPKIISNLVWLIQYWESVQVGCTTVLSRSLSSHLFLSFSFSPFCYYIVGNYQCRRGSYHLSLSSLSHLHVSFFLQCSPPTLIAINKAIN